MKVKLLSLLIMLLLSFTAIQATDSVSIALYNVTGTAYVTNGEIIYATDASDVPIQYRVEISFQSDSLLGGIGTGFVFSADEALNINWEPQVGGFGDGTFVTDVPGGRLDPVSGATFDLGGLLVTEQNVDSIAPDSIMVGGAAMNNGLAAGPMEHMLSLNFSIGYTGTGTAQLTIDSSKIGVAGDFIFIWGSTATTIEPNFSDAIMVSVQQKPGTAVEGNPAIANTYGLDQNFPNPFNPTTTISYSLARKSNVNIAVFNVLGQKVKTLVNGEMDAGIQSVTWNSDDESGKTVASGIYFYKMITDEYIETHKMVLMR